jgi:hypothetical protein
MRLCPNPACPFRVRHGFAAEFEDRVERCRSCDTELDTPAEAPDEPTSPWRALVRLGVSVALVAALVGFSSVAVPGFEDATELAHELGTSVGFAELCLWPAVRALILATILVELVAFVLPAGRALRTQPEGRQTLYALALVLALAGLLLGAWLHHRSLLDSAGLESLVPSLPMMLLTRSAGLPLVLGIASLNERWGLGHGISVVLAALVVDILVTTLPTHADVPHQLALLAVILAGALVWLSRPARAGATGRKPLTEEGDRELGLGLTIPTSSVIPVLIPAVLLVVAFAPPPLSVLGVLVGVVGGVNLEGVAPWLEVSVVVGFAAVLAWAFTRPTLLLERWRRAFPRADPSALAHEAQATFRRGLLRSELLLVATWLLTREQLLALPVLVLAAIILDLGAELRLRLHEPELVALPSHLDLPGAESLVLALRLQRRPALLQARHHRALYRALGWWLPTRVLLRPEDLAQAKQLRTQLLGSPSDQAPT